MAVTVSYNYADLGLKSIAAIIVLNEKYVEGAEILDMSDLEFCTAVADLNDFVFKKYGTFAVSSELSRKLKEEGILNG